MMYSTKSRDKEAEEQHVLPGNGPPAYDQRHCTCAKPKGSTQEITFAYQREGSGGGGGGAHNFLGSCVSEVKLSAEEAVEGAGVKVLGLLLSQRLPLVRGLQGNHNKRPCQRSPLRPNTLPCIPYQIYIIGAPTLQRLQGTSKPLRGSPA